MSEADDDEDDHCAAKLRVLANRTRLKLVEVLMDGPQKVGQLAALLTVDQPLVSYHLRILREAGLVAADRQGKSVFYALAPNVDGTGRHLNLGCCRLSFDE